MFCCRLRVRGPPDQSGLLGVSVQRGCCGGLLSSLARHGGLRADGAAPQPKRNKVNTHPTPSVKLSVSRLKEGKEYPGRNLSRHPDTSCKRPEGRRTQQAECDWGLEIVLCAPSLNDHRTLVALCHIAPPALLCPWVTCCLTIVSAHRWEFLTPVQKTGSPLPREAIARRCARDYGLLRFLCVSASHSAAAAAAAAQTSSSGGGSGATAAGRAKLFSFYAAVVVEALTSLGSTNEALLRALVPSVVQGLSATRSPEYQVRSFWAISVAAASISCCRVLFGRLRFFLCGCSTVLVNNVLCGKRRLWT